MEAGTRRAEPVSRDGVARGGTARTGRRGAGLLARSLKRLVDVGGAAAGIVVFLPVLVASAAWVRLDSPGPVLFRQTRVGRGGEFFRMLKFRTMYHGSGDLLEVHMARDLDSMRRWRDYQKLHDDPRVTTAGRVLRRLSLDELPQLFNVLAGHMSLVGPRPILPAQRAAYGEAALQEYVSTRPGLTGLWQVSGRNRLSFAERVRLDQEYLRDRTPGRDARILLRTVRVILSGDGAF